MNVENLIDDFENKKISKSVFMEKLKTLPYLDIDFAKIDNHRQIRTGMPEVIFANGKTSEYLIRILNEMVKSHDVVIATKLRKEQEKTFFEEFKPQFIEDSLLNTIKKNPNSNMFYSKIANLAVYMSDKAKKKILNPTTKYVSVATAGTSDIPIAEESAITLEAFGISVKRINDIGVSGYHRVLDKKKVLDESDYIIVLAGMEAALPSIISGLTTKQVLAVPTSVGYGASFEGLSALLGMLNSCAPGISVFNIDNGFGAAYFAAIGFKNAKLI